MMHVGAYRRPDCRREREREREGAGNDPPNGRTGGRADGVWAGGVAVRGDYTRFHCSLSVVVNRGPRAAIGATRDEF